MADVFISYSRKDIVFARRLYDSLEASGRNAWIDWEDIPYSVDWWQEIRRALDEADSFVFIISPDSLASEVCNREITYARENNKRIIPIMHRDIDTAATAAVWTESEWGEIARENWDAVRRLNWINMRGIDTFGPAFEGLVRTLEETPEHVRLHSRFLVRAREWDESGRADGYLLRGDDLSRAEYWLEFGETLEPLPNDLHRTYIAASIAERERLAAMDQRRRQVLRSLVVVLSVLLLVALMATAVAFSQRQIAEDNAERADRGATEVAVQAMRAENNAATAERSAEISRSVALAAASRQALVGGDGDLALLLALEANAVSPAPPQAGNALIAAAYNPGARRQFETGGLWATGIALSDDGRYLAVTSFSGRLFVWDVVTGEQVAAQPVMPGGQIPLPLSDMVFRGDRIYTASLGTLVELDASSFEQTNSYFIDGSRIRGISISPDGEQALLAAEARLVVFDLVPGVVTGRWRGHDGIILDVDHSPDGTQAITGGNDGQSILWDVRTGAVVHQHSDYTGTVLAVAFGPGGRTYALGTSDGEVIVRRVSDGAVERRWQAHTGSLNDLAYSPDGDYLATVSEDRRVILWDQQTGVARQVYRGHREGVAAVMFASDGESLFTGANDGAVRQWSIDPANVLDRRRVHQGQVNGIVTDGESVFSAGADRAVYRWTGDTVVWRSAVHADAVQAVALAGDGVLSASLDGRLRLLDRDSGDVVREYDTGLQITGMAYHGERVVLAVGDPVDVSLQLWLFDLADWEVVWRGEPLPLRSTGTVDFSPDGRYVLVNYNNLQVAPTGVTGQGRALVFSAGDGQPVSEAASTGRVYRAVFSPDSTRLLTLAEDNSARLFDVESGTLLRQYTGHQSDVVSGAFSADGSRILTGSTDGTVILWETATAAEIIRLDLFEVPVFAITFAGDEALVGASDGTVVRLQVPQADIVDWVRENRYVAEPTCEQRLQYDLRPLCDAAPTPTAVLPTITAPASPSLAATATPDLSSATEIITPMVTPTADLVLMGLVPMDGEVTEEDIQIGISGLGFTPLLPSEANYTGFGKLSANQIDNLFMIESGGYALAYGVENAEGQVFVVVQSETGLESVRDWLPTFAETIGMGAIPPSVEFPGILDYRDIEGMEVLRVNASIILQQNIFLYVIVRDGTQVLVASPDAEQEAIEALIADILRPGPLPPTLAPSATPTPASEQVQVLDRFGIDPSNGGVSDRMDEHVIDMGGRVGSTFWQRFAGTYTDFVISTQFEWRGGGDADDGCGFSLREQDSTNRQTVQFTQGGSVFYNTIVDGQWGQDTLLFVPERLAADGINQMTVAVTGDTFTLFINGVYVTQYREPRYERGWVGVEASSASGLEGAGCVFSDAWIWALDRPATPIPSPTPEPPPDPYPSMLAALDAMGLADGQFAAWRDFQVIDLTGLDDWTRWQQLPGEYGVHALGTTIAWGPGATDDSCGVFFRATDNQDLYMVRINRQGDVLFDHLLAGQWQSSQSQTSTAIDRTGSAVNDLAVRVNRDAYTVYINGQEAATFEDATLARGQSGVAMGTAFSSDVTFCTFTDTWLWVPE